MESVFKRIYMNELLTLLDKRERLIECHINGVHCQKVNSAIYIDHGRYLFDGGSLGLPGEFLYKGMKYINKGPKRTDITITYAGVDALSIKRGEDWVELSDCQTRQLTVFYDMGDIAYLEIL